MKNLSLIVAIGKNNELGINNGLIWHLKGDMRYFKETTTGHTIIMGRKTFISLHGLLPNRKHIVITSNKDFKYDDVIVMNDVKDALNYVKNSNDECFVIGGATIYEEFLDYANKLYITEIDASEKSDVYFPKFDKNLYDKYIIKENEEDGIKYNFVLYTKRSK